MWIVRKNSANASPTTLHLNSNKFIISYSIHMCFYAKTVMLVHKSASALIIYGTLFLLTYLNLFIIAIIISARFALGFLDISESFVHKKCFVKFDLALSCCTWEWMLKLFFYACGERHSLALNHRKDLHFNFVLTINNFKFVLLIFFEHFISWSRCGLVLFEFLS